MAVISSRLRSAGQSHSASSSSSPTNKSGDASDGQPVGPWCVRSPGHAATDHSARLRYEGLVSLDLEYGGVGRAPPGSILQREGPRWLSVLALADTGRRGGWFTMPRTTGPGSARWRVRSSGPVPNTVPVMICGRGLADPQPLGHLTETKVFKLSRGGPPPREGTASVVENGTELRESPDRGVGSGY